ncbi:MAG: class I SAM-dependent methyltransferase family protein [Cyanobacteria bacterium P01_F01_bin.150]
MSDYLVSSSSTPKTRQSSRADSFPRNPVRENKHRPQAQREFGHRRSLHRRKRSYRQPSYESLLRPLPLWHPKAWYYGCFRLGLSTIGRLSRGIQIGLTSGFDSGVMLEHVYRNKAQGITVVGKMIDRCFLNAPGWRGIRQRGRLLSRTIGTTVQQVAEPSRPCTVLDVACGGGRYLLEALSIMDPELVHLVLRDYREENVRKARQLAQTLGIQATIEQADAFSDADLNRVNPRPDVVIVSGLHEIIDDDNLLQRHLHQLHQLLPPSGYLILTVQPWHPQLELIARGLRSHTGSPWVMRLRSLELTEQWLRTAGFETLELQMEQSGIFGVLVARKQ